MADEMLKISHLSKSFGSRVAVNDLTLNLYRGEVFGFAGPNGAGKTTTIKMITGLLMPDEGTVSISGYDISKHYEQAMEHMGAIVECPEMYNYLSGHENLRQVARMRGGIDEQRIMQTAKLVGLENRINEKVKKYSLGMKQRLGVALAILHRPGLLVLDEPTNGLDPSGIKELRDLFKTLAQQENCCVMVSSHLMAELELMCDRVGFIANGSLIRVDSVKNLSDARLEAGCIYRYEVDNISAAMALLDGTDIKHAADGGAMEIILTGENRNTVNSLLINGGIDILSMQPVQRRLEDVFMQLVGKNGGKQIG